VVGEIIKKPNCHPELDPESRNKETLKPFLLSIFNFLLISYTKPSKSVINRYFKRLFFEN